MSDAYRLNWQCAEFDAEDMKSTKFMLHFSLYQTLTSHFLKTLEVITTAEGADVIPVSAMEILVKFLKTAEMIGRPILVLSFSLSL